MRDFRSITNGPKGPGPSERSYAIPKTNGPKGPGSSEQPYAIPKTNGPKGPQIMFRLSWLCVMYASVISAQAYELIYSPR